MIDALIAGRLYGAPQQRTAKTGKAFVTGKLRVSVANGETAFISFICFAPPAVAAILALQDGDSVALRGELSVRCGPTRPPWRAWGSTWSGMWRLQATTSPNRQQVPH
jgi:hypothetical protein